MDSAEFTLWVALLTKVEPYEEQQRQQAQKRRR